MAVSMTEEKYQASMRNERVTVITDTFDMPENSHAWKLWKRTHRMRSAHHKRLEQALQVLRIDRYTDSFPNESRLRKLIYELVLANQLQDAYVRITVTRGMGEIGLTFNESSDATIFIMSKPYAAVHPSIYDMGRSLIVCEHSHHSPILGYPGKWTSYMPHVLAWHEAQSRNAAEGIQLTSKGIVAEGTVSNLFFVKNGTLHTPSLQLGILPGITRELVIQGAEELQIPITEGEYSIEQWMQADESFTTSPSTSTQA